MKQIVEVKCDTNHNFVHRIGVYRSAADAGKQILGRVFLALIALVLTLSQYMQAQFSAGNGSEEDPYITWRHN